MGSDMRTRVNNAAFEALDITDVVVDFVAACGGSTDVVWFESSASPPDKYGDNNCQSPSIPYNSTIQCDQYYNRLYPNRYSLSSYPNMFAMKVACHEFGHSVGLTHGTEGAAHCMSNGVLNTTATSYRRYVTHHVVDHINQWW